MGNTAETTKGLTNQPLHPSYATELCFQQIQVLLLAMSSHLRLFLLALVCCFAFTDANLASTLDRAREWSKKRCRKTTSDQLGPFWVHYDTTSQFLNPQFQNPNLIPDHALAPENEVNLYVRGRVFKNCRALSYQAKIEVWHASPDSENAYYTCRPKSSAENKNCVSWQESFVRPEVLTKKLWYRGIGITKTKYNEYEYRTSMPGIYAARTIPHIHYKVTYGGKEFVTQMYFKDRVPPSFKGYLEGRDSQFGFEYHPFVTHNITTHMVFDIYL